MNNSTKTLLFWIMVLGGFVLILVFLPRIINAILASFGWKFSRAILLLFVALTWYVWGEVCVRIKQRFNIDEEEE